MRLTSDRTSAAAATAAFTAPAVAVRSQGWGAAHQSVPLFLAIALIQGDAFIHILAIREHFAEWWGYGVFFAGVTAAQIAYSLLLAWRPTRGVAVAGIAGSVFLVGLYALSRTAGIPLFGPHAGHVEEVEGLDLLSKALEVAMLLPLALLASRPALSARSKVADPDPQIPLDTVTRVISTGIKGRRSLVTLAAGAAVVLVLLVVGYRFGTGLDFGSWGGTVSATDVASCAKRSCDVHFTATLAARAYAERLGIWNEIEPRAGLSQAFVVTATAHAGAAGDLSMDDRVFLRQDGVLYPAAGRPLAVTTHHNTHLIFFPKYDMDGRPLLDRSEGTFDILIRDPETAGSRVLTFNFPLVKTTGPGLPLPQVLITLGAAMAALLFACTPCLVGSLAVGSITTGTAVSCDRRTVREQIRRRIIRQTLIYLLAVVAAYLAVAIAVSVFRLDAKALRPVEFTGGLALIIVGGSLLRAWRPAGVAARWASVTIRGALRRGKVSGRADLAFNEGSASAMGASLAMVCSVAGAPTLSTAILLPLLVYAGLTSPLWAIALLALYLLVCAVPFFFVAVGWGEFLVNASMRWRTGILIASSVVLIALGLLLVLSPAAVANTISAPARHALGPLTWFS